MSEADLFKPLVPPHADLRDFDFMPLDVVQLRSSRTWLRAKRDPALGFYLVNLWTSAWHAIPAGSLEDDDDVLAAAAMASQEEWSRLRAELLRGWCRCEGGRLWHPVVAAKAAAAWQAKVRQRQHGKAGAEKRWGVHRHPIAEGVGIRTTPDSKERVEIPLPSLLTERGGYRRTSPTRRPQQMMERGRGRPASPTPTPCAC
jgi:uncharacterized protein YdaU (DUF1376 family)